MAHGRQIEHWKLTTTFLLMVMLGSLASSVAQAKWTDGLDILMPVALLGVIAGAFLSSSRLGAVRAHIIGLIIGFFFVLWQTGQTIPEAALGDSSRIGMVWHRLIDWLSIVLSGGVGEDQLLFVFTMGAIAWLLAYDSAWFVLRYGWVWGAVLPIGLVILVNLGYSAHPHQSVFITFLIASMLLVMQAHLVKSRMVWDREGLRQEPGIGSKTLMLGLVVSVVLLFIAWHGPTKNLTANVRTAIQQVQQPWKGIENRWEKAFAFLGPGLGGSNIPGLGAMGGGFTSFNDSFKLGGPLSLGNAPVFKATGQGGQYWRSVAFDTYTGRGWESSVSQPDTDKGKVVQAKTIDPNALSQKLPDGMSKNVQHVSVILPVGKSLFGANRQISVDRDAKWQIGVVTKTGEVPVTGKLTKKQIANNGQELREVRDLLSEIGPENVVSASADGVVLRQKPPTIVTPRAWGRGAEQGSSWWYRKPVTVQPTTDPTTIAQTGKLHRAFVDLEKQGIHATYERHDGKTPTIKYTYQAENPNDVANLTSVKPVHKGDTYTVTSIVSNPSDKQLNADNAPAPDWIKDRYLQLPSDLPPQVHQLALQITAGAKTKHEKAQRIQDYLRKFKYNENMPYTPPGQDFVAYFLFNQKQGYCTYFSSAMAVMLRSLDIPTRVVTGFAPGKLDTNTGQYLVTESQAHAWPQVYYDKYGWVNYEPTPIRALVSRPSDEPITANISGGGSGNIDPAELCAQQVNMPGIPSIECPQQAGSGVAGAGEESGPVLPMPLVVVLGVILGLLLIILLAFAWALLKLRGLHGTRRQYAKLMQVGALLGTGHIPSQTPAEYGNRLSGILPHAQQPIGRITRQYAAEVFGHGQLGRSSLKSEWRRVAFQALRNAPGRTLQNVRESRFLGFVRRALRR